MAAHGRLYTAEVYNGFADGFLVSAALANRATIKSFNWD